MNINTAASHETQSGGSEEIEGEALGVYLILVANPLQPPLFPWFSLMVLTSRQTF